MEGQASTEWMRGNDTSELTSTQADSVSRRSVTSHTPPAVAIGDVGTRQEDRQQYNLRSWLTKDADSTNKKRKDNKARCEST
jgi:hypothetical protein